MCQELSEISELSQQSESAKDVRVMQFQFSQGFLLSIDLEGVIYIPELTIEFSSVLQMLQYMGLPAMVRYVWDLQLYLSLYLSRAQY